MYIYGINHNNPIPKVSPDNIAQPINERLKQKYLHLFPFINSSLLLTISFDDKFGSSFKIYKVKEYEKLLIINHTKEIGYINKTIIPNKDEEESPVRALVVVKTIENPDNIILPIVNNIGNNSFNKV